MFSKIAIVATVAVVANAVRISTPDSTPEHQKAFNGSLANMAAWNSYVVANKANMAAAKGLRVKREAAVQAYFAAMAKDKTDSAANTAAAHTASVSAGVAATDAGAAANAVTAANDAKKAHTDATAATVAAKAKALATKNTQAGLVAAAEAAQTAANGTEAGAVAAAVEHEGKMATADSEAATASTAAAAKASASAGINSANQATAHAALEKANASKAAVGTTREAAEAAHKDFRTAVEAHFTAGNF